jgi:hypothetical protein
MNTIADIEFSRLLVAVQELGEAAREDGSFVDKTVLLTGEAAVLRTANGRWMAEDCLRLMVRTWRKLAVYLPSGLEPLKHQLKSLASEIVFSDPVTFLETEPCYGDYEGILSIGTQAQPNLPWTVINSNGWLARVSSSSTPLALQCSQANPLGALAAASFGVADVFKRTALKREFFDLVDELTFSCFDFSVGGEDPGPPLPESLEILPTLFLGQGAIGNANVLLAGQLPLRGRALLLDKDQYGKENLGTCVLLGPRGAAKQVAKAKWNRDQLRAAGSGIDAEHLCEDIEKAKIAVEPYLGLVINGLDQVEPRHTAQDLWPDAIVDGALRRFQCQFVAYDHDAGLACLRCLFELPAGRNPIEVQVELTGLSAAALAADEVIGDGHIAAAPKDKRTFLESKRGQKTGAVGCARAIEMAHMFADGVKEGFAPSVPFVATMTGVLVMAEMVRRLMNLPTTVRRFQFDMLVGPQAGSKINEKASPGCRCQTRKGPIEKQRERWKSRQGGEM